jgi:hypothetical protein
MSLNVSGNITYQAARCVFEKFGDVLKSHVTLPHLGFSCSYIRICCV